MTRQCVAEVQIGATSSRLFIHDGTGRGTSLNLIWRDTERPIFRADELLRQNGYDRIGAWIDQPGGFHANVTAEGETSACSWLKFDASGKAWVEQVGHGCADHRTLWERAS